MGLLGFRVKGLELRGWGRVSKGGGVTQVQGLRVQSFEFRVYATTVGLLTASGFKGFEFRGSGLSPSSSLLSSLAVGDTTTYEP